MRDKVYVYIVKPGEELWDITHLTSEELISNFSDERITVRLLYDEEIFNDLINNPRMLIVSRKKLGPNYDQHFSWNIYEASFYEFNSDVYPHGPYEIMTGKKKPCLGILSLDCGSITPQGLQGRFFFRPARKDDIPSHNINNHMTIIGYSGNSLDNYTGYILSWSPPLDSTECTLRFVNYGGYKAMIRTYTKSSGLKEHYINLPELYDIRAVALQTNSPNIVRLMIYHRDGVFDSGFHETELDIVPLYYLKVYAPGNGTYIKRVAVLGPNTLPFDNGYFPLYLVAGRMPDGSEPKWGTYDPDIFFYVVYPKWVKRIYFESGKMSNTIEFTARNLLDYTKEQFYDYTLVDAERYSKDVLNNAYWRVGDRHIPKPAPRIIEGYEHLNPEEHFTIQEMPLSKVSRKFEDDFSAENEFPIMRIGESVITLKTYREGTNFSIKPVVYMPDGYVKEGSVTTWANVRRIYDMAYKFTNDSLYILLLMLTDNTEHSNGLRAWAVKYHLTLSTRFPVTFENWWAYWEFDRFRDFECRCDGCDFWQRDMKWNAANYFDNPWLEPSIMIYVNEIIQLDSPEESIVSCIMTAYEQLSFDTSSEHWMRSIIGENIEYFEGAAFPREKDIISSTYSNGYYVIDKNKNLIYIDTFNNEIREVDVSRIKQYLQNDPLLLQSRYQFVWIISGKIIIQAWMHAGTIESAKLWVVDSEIRYSNLSRGDTPGDSYLFLYSSDKIYKANISTLIREHEDSLDAHILPAKTYKFQSLENDFYTFLPYPKFLFSTKEMKVWDRTEKFWVIWGKDTLTLTDHYEDIETPKSIMQKLPDIEEKAKRKLQLFPPSLIVGVPEYPLDADIYINDIMNMPIEVTPSDVVEVNYFARHRISSFWFRYFILGDLKNYFNDESITIDTDDWYAQELATRLNNFLKTTMGIELLIIGIRTDLRRGVKFHFDGKDWLVEEARYYLAQGNTRVKAKEIRTFQTESKSSNEEGGKQ